MQFLQENGHSVVSDLIDKNIDLILLTEPRPGRASACFGPIEIERYLRKINGKAIVVHRINECDERKNTRTVNKILCAANQIADHTIYIATWLVELFNKQSLKFSPSYSVILNGADSNVFVYRKRSLPENGKIRLVTHHWSSNYMKGWDIYHYIDDLMERDIDFRNRFEFHYIGNAPQKIKCNHIHFHPPCNGAKLAEKLNNCHIYVTASICEPAGMHHIEGALCGLPLLYRESGALPEYCRGYGISFNGNHDFIESLNSVVDQYDYFTHAIGNYENNAKKMCETYHTLFCRLLRNKEEILLARGKKFFGLRKAVYLQIYFAAVRLIHMLGLQ